MPTRSTFVTVLAWLFIVGSGFASIIGAIQAVMITLLFDDDLMGPTVTDAPSGMSFLFNHFNLFAYAFWALMVLTLIASIGLLKRRNWARLTFIALMVVGIVWQWLGVAFQFFVMSDMPEPPTGQGGETFMLMRQVIVWFTLAVAVGLSGVFGWIIKRLCGQPVVEEFSPEQGRETGV